MSSCAPCLCTLTLPTCFTTLVVGTVGALNTDYKIYIKNLTTGKTVQYSATSSGAGLVSITVSASTPFSESHSYVLWATLATGTVDEREDITISGTITAQSCFELKFETIREADGDFATFTTVTLKKDSCCEENLNEDCICITQTEFDNLLVCEEVSKTVAEMQALVGSFDTCVQYLITDVQSSFGVLRIRARNANVLETHGQLLKGGVIYEAGYQLSTNLICEIRDIICNNKLSYEPVYANNIITNWIYNDVDYYSGNTILDCNLTISDNAYASLLQNNLTGTTITITRNGCLTRNIISNISGNAVISLTGASGGNGCILASCDLGTTAHTITLSGGTSLIQCVIKTSLTFVGETYTLKSIDDLQSTFTKSRTIAASGAFDFDNAGYNESFVGIWTISAAAPRNITSFNNNTFTHERTFILATGSAITFVDDGVNIFMKGSANAVLANAGDYVTFKFVGNVAYEIDRGIY